MRFPASLPSLLAALRHPIILITQGGLWEFVQVKRKQSAGLGNPTRASFVDRLCCSEIVTISNFCFFSEVGPILGECTSYVHEAPWRRILGTRGLFAET